MDLLLSELKKAGREVKLMQLRLVAVQLCLEFNLSIRADETSESEGVRIERVIRRLRAIKGHRGRAVRSKKWTWLRLLKRVRDLQHERKANVIAVLNGRIPSGCASIVASFDALHDKEKEIAEDEAIVESFVLGAENELLAEWYIHDVFDGLDTDSD